MDHTVKDNTPKVLIIDDHKTWLSVLSSILTQSGFDVKTASTAVSGISQAESDPPDIILLDLMMPEMDGYEVCRHIRSNKELDNASIFIISARANPVDEERALSAGANDYLIKPVHPIELISRMHELINKKAEPNKEIAGFPNTRAIN